MRKGVIVHPAQAQLVIIREDYLAICDDDHCAAAILNVFEFWTDVKLHHRDQAEIQNAIAEAGGQSADQDTELWIYKSQPELIEELLKLFGETKVGKGLALLITKGYLETRNNPKFGWDRTLQYRFNVEAVQAAIDTVKIRGASRKNTASKPQKHGMKAVKTRRQSRKNKGAIPETPSQDTSPTTLMKNAIRDAFQWNDPTREEWGVIQKAASSLLESDVPPEMVQQLYDECVRRKWKDFSPVALTKVVSDVRRAQTPKQAQPISSTGYGGGTVMLKRKAKTP